ncbi:hypothetical protein [Paraburkholderia sp.]|uniref:hypothetical protein n=1 Tax=Paraburkholderia sp. TaxID=1926495 RepID=UPI002390E932|nr:hypothetical protein [Paraburkholderia sp.]MDE1183083.1 hypothetical protein [Paraburkholderia sp.]
MTSFRRILIVLSLSLLALLATRGAYAHDCGSMPQHAAMRMNPVAHLAHLALAARSPAVMSSRNALHDTPPTHCADRHCNGHQASCCTTMCGAHCSALSSALLNTSGFDAHSSGASPPLAFATPSRVSLTHAPLLRPPIPRPFSFSAVV